MSINRKELGIFVEVFRIIKDAKRLLLVFCKAVYVKVQQMNMETGVNMINMTGNVNEKLRKRKVGKRKTKTSAVLESICLRIFRRKLAPTSLGMCENLREKSQFNFNNFR